MLNENEALYEILVKVIIEPDEDGFYAYAPALPGLHIDGTTEDEALERVREGVVVYLETLQDTGKPLPVGPDLMVRWIAGPYGGFSEFGVGSSTGGLPKSQPAQHRQITVSWPTQPTQTQLNVS